MTLPIKIKTSFGNEQFGILHAQFEHHREIGMAGDFRERCNGDFKTQEKYLEYFLDSDEFTKEYPMNDSDPKGFEIFNEHSDICSALKYFSEKRS